MHHDFLVFTLLIAQGPAIITFHDLGLNHLTNFQVLGQLYFPRYILLPVCLKKVVSLWKLSMCRSSHGWNIEWKYILWTESRRRSDKIFRHLCPELELIICCPAPVTRLRLPLWLKTELLPAKNQRLYCLWKIWIPFLLCGRICKICCSHQINPRAKNYNQFVEIFSFLHWRYILASPTFCLLILDEKLSVNTS